MHLPQSFEHTIQYIPAGIFGEALMVEFYEIRLLRLEHRVSETTPIHEFHYDNQFLPILVQLFNLDYLFAIKVG